MNQNQLADLFDTSKQNISLHILNILKEKELEGISVVKDYLITALDGRNEQFDARQKAYDAELADKQDEAELLELESQIKAREN